MSVGYTKCFGPFVCFVEKDNVKIADKELSWKYEVPVYERRELIVKQLRAMALWLETYPFDWESTGQKASQR
jgi:hypothetical protein